ncbi:MAG: hypothetical protein QXT44_04755, partial [Candidatus Bathyarchaeia archaeon]
MTSKSTHKTKIAIIFLVGYLTNLLILFLEVSLQKAGYYGIMSASFIALLLGFISYHYICSLNAKNFEIDLKMMFLFQRLPRLFIYLFLNKSARSYRLS